MAWATGLARTWINRWERSDQSARAALAGVTRRERARENTTDMRKHRDRRGKRGGHTWWIIFPGRYRGCRRRLTGFGRSRRRRVMHWPRRWTLGAALPPSIEEGGITPYELRDYREPWSCWCPRTIQLLAPSVPLYPVAADVAGRHSHPGRLPPVGCRRSPASPTTPRRGSRHGRPPDRSHYQSSQRHVHAEGKQHRRRHPAASERNDVVAVSAICRSCGIR